MGRINDQIVESPEDHRRLIPDDVPQLHFRAGRNEDDFNKHDKAKKILQCLCMKLCLYQPSGIGLKLSIVLVLICVFQLVYDLYVITACPGFDCGFLEKKLEQSGNETSSLRKTSNTLYTLASIGGFFSYTLLLVSLISIHHEKLKKENSKAVGPSDVLFKDLSNTQVKVIFISQVLILILFVSSVVMFYYLIRLQPKSNWYFYLMVPGITAQFVAQWAAIVGCHVFAISSLALGTLANDTIRRIRLGISGQETRKRGTWGAYGATLQQQKQQQPSCHRLKQQQLEDQQFKELQRNSYEELQQQRHHHHDQQHGQQQRPLDHYEYKHPEQQQLQQQATNPNPEAIVSVSTEEQETSSTFCQTHTFDIALEYHEELCAIVSDTVSAYCPWFVIHWICYGATCLIGVVNISKGLMYSKNPVNFAYLYVGTFLVMQFYVFLLPCCCAAYITKACGGIYSRINRTTSKYWPTDHPFKNRLQLMLFTSYTKDRQCVFKIGGLTFTPTLAWISLLLGLTGLLFHFF